MSLVFSDDFPGAGGIRASRRAFLETVAAAAAAAALPRAASAMLQAEGLPPPDVSQKRLVADLHARLSTDDPRLFELAVKTYSECILGKIRAPEPPLEHAWIVPGGGYNAQWLWDTMFVCDLLAILPGQDETIRGVFQNYWDFQQRWNAAQPDFMHGMVANFMAPFDAPGARDGKQWRTFPAYSQAPLLAWGMERVFRRTGDRQLLRSGLQPLEHFHEWYWRERDVSGAGLVGVGAYSGDVQHARYETYDREVDLDDLHLTPHPARRPGTDNGPWYGDILIPANTSYLLLSELALARMAKTMGDSAMAARRGARYATGAQAMRRCMWSEAAGCFVAVHRDSLQPITTATVGGFMPLAAGVPTAVQAALMAKALTGEAWATPLPVPTVARNSKRFSSGEFWRGDVWPAPDFQIASGLAAYGLKREAAGIADAQVANSLRVGISERYDSLSGAPLGVRGLGMSATVLTMMFDGLTLDYTLQVEPIHAESGAGKRP